MEEIDTEKTRENMWGTLRRFVKQNHRKKFVCDGRRKALVVILFMGVPSRGLVVTELSSSKMS
jgi:hypothetical protein